MAAPKASSGVGMLFANYAAGCENMRFCDCSSALAADAAAS